MKFISNPHFLCLFFKGFSLGLLKSLVPTNIKMISWVDNRLLSIFENYTYTKHQEETF